MSRPDKAELERIAEELDTVSPLILKGCKQIEPLFFAHPTYKGIYAKYGWSAGTEHKTPRFLLTWLGLWDKAGPVHILTVRDATPEEKMILGEG
jgi:hypothetical protein